MKLDFQDGPLGLGDTGSNLIPMLVAAPQPVPTTLTMPSLVATANATLPAPAADAQLTPADLNARLPSIVNQTPTQVAPACGSFAQWVSENTLLAVIGLAIGAAVVFGGKRKK